MRRCAVLTCQVLLTLWLACKADDRIPHVDECNFCGRCITDGESPAASPVVGGTWPSLQEQYEQPKGSKASKITTSGRSKHKHARPGYSLSQQNSDASGTSTWNTNRKPAADGHEGHGEDSLLGKYTSLLQPLDDAAKQRLPNCTVCRGCTVDLELMGRQDVPFRHVSFTHGFGATTNWLFFARPAGSIKRYVLKVLCIPFSKTQGTDKPVMCSAKQYDKRTQLVLAQQQLAEECGVQDLYPRVWLAPVSAVIPGYGYHVRWHGLWMEEAPGITLHGLLQARSNKLTLTLLGSSLNKTQVVLGAMMDLLTAQCDRHSENIFINEDGGLTFIDNDKALGVINHCGYDTMLIPGSRYHSLLRIGYWNHLANYYRKYGKTLDFCKGPVDPRVVIDYRCYVPNGQIGTDYPSSMKQCMQRISSLSLEEIKQRYGLMDDVPATILKNRATDMLTHGFEWTMMHGEPSNGPRFNVPHQPPCCGLAVQRGMITCDRCWKPLLPEEYKGQMIYSKAGSAGAAGVQFESLISGSKQGRIALNGTVPSKE